jgi:hypothetical protein
VNPEETTSQSSSASPAPKLFVVSFEHAQRSFKCVRIELTTADDAPHAEQWVVTVAGRPVWSFMASESDTRASVQSEVMRWWNQSVSNSE